jgi:hypothetical protein
MMALWSSRCAGCRQRIKGNRPVSSASAQRATERVRVGAGQSRAQDKTIIAAESEEPSSLRTRCRREPRSMRKARQEARSGSEPTISSDSRDPAMGSRPRPGPHPSRSLAAASLEERPSEKTPICLVDHLANTTALRQVKTTAHPLLMLRPCSRFVLSWAMARVNTEAAAASEQTETPAERPQPSSAAIDESRNLAV